jgi:hypothetical protein
MVTREKTALVSLSTSEPQLAFLRNDAPEIAAIYAARLGEPALREPLDHLLHTSANISGLHAIALAAQHDPSQLSVLSVFAVADFDAIKPEPENEKSLRRVLDRAYACFDSSLRGSSRSLATSFWHFRTCGAPFDTWSKRFREELHELPENDVPQLEPFLLAIAARTK